MRIVPIIAVALFLCAPYNGIIPEAAAQVPALTDLQRLVLCTGQNDDCLVQQFFEDPNAPHQSWSHTSFLLPPELDLDAIGDDNSFLFTLEAGQLVGLIESGDVIHAMHGGNLPTAALNGTDWFHAAMTYEPGSWRLYLDGALAAERTNINSTINPSAQPLTWGYVSAPQSVHLPGAIGDVRVYDHALTESEIVDTKRIGEGLSPLDPANTNIDGAVAIWPANEGTGTSIEDTAGTYDATTVGDPTWTTQGTGYGILLDGLDDGAVAANFTLPAQSDALTVAGWFKLDTNAPGAAAAEGNPIPLVGQWQTQAELRFIDTGARIAGTTGLMKHSQTTDVDDDWDSLILCRFYVTPDTPTPCLDGIAPYAINVGHNLDWADRSNPPLFSTWRVATPALDIPATPPTRVHGPDASTLRLTQHMRTGNPGGTNATGQLDIDCAYVAFFPYQEAITNGSPTPGGDVQYCPSNKVAQSEQKPDTIPASSAPGDLLWCEDPITDHSKQVHQIEALERSLWIAAGTCDPIDPVPLELTWDDFLAFDMPAFATALADLIDASSDADKEEARGAVDAVLRKIIADRLAIYWQFMGMPMDVVTNGLVPPGIISADEFHVVDIRPDDITIGTATAANNGAFVDLVEPALLAFTKATLPITVTLNAPQGGQETRTLDIFLLDNQPVLEADHDIVQYGTTIAGSVAAKDPDNRDYALGFAPGSLNPFTIPLLNISDDGTVLGESLFEIGYKVPITTPDLTSCASQLWAADPEGLDTNYVGGEFGVEHPDLAVCSIIDLSERIKLNLFETISITLEVREGPITAAWPEVVGSITKTLVNISDPDGQITIQDAYGDSAPVGVETPMDAGTIRLVLTVPFTSHIQKADLAAFLLVRLGGLVDTFAFEMYDVPLLPHLKEAVERAVTQYQATILVPSGSLPDPAGDNLPALAIQDRLLSITGLAAHPQVLTIGGGSLATGADPLNRLGPTALYAPKPDFLAPSPAGSTIGAVMNVLPYVEALQLRGLHHMQMVKAVLAGLTVPVTSTNSNGDTLPATFYEQGYGAIDLGAFLNLGMTSGELITLIASKTQESETDIEAQIVDALAIEADELDDATANEILGAAVHPEQVIRAALSNVLLRLTLDTPAIPTTLLVDHGVVNHERVGSANVIPFDLDAVIASTVNVTKALLRDVGYTGTDLDDITAEILRRINIQLEEGQEVTVNLTHYALFDALSQDLLYTVYDKVLDASIEENGAFLRKSVENFTTDPANATRELIEDWLLEAYNFTDEWHGQLETKIDVDETCIIVPIVSTLIFGDKVIRIIRDQLGLLSGTVHESAGVSIGTSLPLDSRTVLGRSGQQLVQGELTQVACARDVRAFLLALRTSANDLHELKSLPYGHWSESEQLGGAWGWGVDGTPAGAAINETLETLGIDPEEFKQDSPAYVLNLTIESIDAALALLDQKVSLLGLPKQTIVDYTKAAMDTKPAETGDAPLGPYVGLALVTSHNITLYNPFTNETILTRDISVPLPAFLWNNPSFDLKPEFRDGSALKNATAAFVNQKEDVFSRVDVNTSFVQDGVVIPLWADQTDTRSREIALLENLIENVTEALDTIQPYVGAAPPQPYATLDQQLRELNETFNERLNWLIGLPDLSSSAGDLTEGVLELLLKTLYTRMPYQADRVDQDGVAEFPNLFPGTYQLFAPYPYHEVVHHTLNYDYANPGSEGYAGPMIDLDWSSQALAGGTLASLTGQDPDNSFPSVPTFETVDDVNRSNVAIWPVHEVDGRRYGPFHQFELDVNGPDILGLACVVLHKLADATDTGIAFPGCGAPLIPSDLIITLLDDISMADCIVGTMDAPEGEGWQYCQEIQDERVEHQAECDAGLIGSCLALDSSLPVGTALGGLSLVLQSLLPSDVTLVPFPHSVRRVVAADNDDYGYSAAELVDRAKNVPSNQAAGFSNQTIEDAVDALLADLDNKLKLAFKLTGPPKKATNETLHPLGLMHHVTDLVAGLDWWHTDVVAINASAGVPDASGIRAELNVLVDMVTNTTDRAVLLAGVNAMKAESDADLLAAFNAGRAWNLTRQAATLNETWTGQGLVTNGLRSVNNTTQTGFMSAQQLCAEAVNWTTLSPAYFACNGDIDFEIDEPCTVSELRTDRIGMINELLTSLRRNATAEPLERLERAVGMTSVGHGWKWSRTDDAIRADASTTVNDCEELPVTPSPALLYYTTPMPVQERVTVRMHGEFLTKDTMAIVIVTPDEEVPRALVDALEKVDEVTVDVDKPLDRIGRALKAVSAVIAKNTDLRADILGFPVRAEDKEAIDPTCALTCTHEAKGLLALRANEHHVFNRVFDFRTATPGANSDEGKPFLHTMVLFLPNVGGTSSPGEDPVRALGSGQKFMVRNLTIQMDTFAGLIDPAHITKGNATLDIPIRYRANVEEWKMLWAAPDQALKTDSTAGLTLDATGLGGSINATNWNWHRAYNFTDMVDEGFYPAGTPDLSTSGWCPNEHLPGLDPNFGGMPRQHRGGPEPMGGDNHWFTWPRDDALCHKNIIQALQPSNEAFVSKEQKHVTPYFEYTNFDKNLASSMAYQLNFAEGVFPEAFSHIQGKVGLNPKCTLCDPLALLTTMSISDAVDLLARIDDAGGFASGALRPPNADLVMEKLQEAMNNAREATQEADAASGDYLADVRQALLPFLALDIPLLQSSFNVSAQHARNNIPAPSDRLHNLAVLNESQAFELMADPWNPAEMVTVVEISNLSLANESVLVPLSADKIEVHNTSQYSEANAYGAVMAWRTTTGYDSNRGEFDVKERNAEPTGEEMIAPTLINRAELLLGNGQTGSGWALDVTATGTAVVADSDGKYLANGLAYGGGVTYQTTLYILGGPTTQGSVCTDIDLYSYVARFYRCTGYSVALSFFAAAGAGGQSPTRCAFDAMNFMNFMSGAGLNNTSQAELWRYTDPFQNLLVDELLASNAEGILAGDPALPGFQSDLGDDLNATEAFGSAAASKAEPLILCLLGTLLPSAGAAPGLPGLTTNITDALKGLVDSLNIRERNRLALNATLGLHPGVGIEGDPINPGPYLTPVGAVLDGPMHIGWWGLETLPVTLVTSYPDEANFSSANVAFEAYDDEGLVYTNASVFQTNETGVHHFSIDLLHGLRYDISVNATDTHGNQGGSSIEVWSDQHLPEFVSLPGPNPWVDVEPTLSWSAKDNLSGLHNVSIEVNAGTGWEVRGVESGASANVTTDYTHLLELVDVSGTVNQVRITLRDLALNSKNVTMTIREDHDDPIVDLPEFPLFANGDLSEVWSAYDAHSGLASLTFEQTGGSDPRVVNLGTAAGGIPIEDTTPLKLGTTDGATIGWAINATDGVGRYTAHADTTVLDISAPTLPSLPTLDVFLNAADDLANVAVSWTAKDVVSGLVAPVLVESGVGPVTPAPGAAAAAGVLAARSHSFALPEVHNAAVTFSATEKDLAGNIATWSETYRVDLLPPRISMTPDVDLATTGLFAGPVNVTIGVDDPVSGVATKEYRLDSVGSFAALGASPVLVTGEGIHTLEVRATDVAGNSNITTFRIGIDLGALVASQVLPLEVDGTIDNVALVAQATAIDAVSGIMDLSYTLYNTTGGSWEPMESNTTIGFAEDFASGSLATNGWTINTSPPNRDGAIVAGGPYGGNNSLMLSHQTNIGQDTTVTAYVEPEGIDRNGTLWLSNDWQWARGGNVTGHSTRISVTFGDPQGANQYNLLYYLGTMPGEALLGNASLRRVFDVRDTETPAHVWTHFERNITDDIATWVPADYPLARISVSMGGAGGAPHDTRSWFDNIRLLRAPPGETARMNVTGSMWHSGTYQLNVTATNGVALTATNAVDPQRAWSAWVTPVPLLDLAPAIANTTFVGGIPVSTQSVGTVVSGLGLDIGLRHALPTGSHVAATYPNGDRIGWDDTSTTDSFAVFSADLTPGSHDIDLFASTDQGSWNQTQVSVQVPPALRVADDLEGSRVRWSFVNSTDPAESAGFLSQDALGYPLPRASGTHAVHVLANKATTAAPLARFNVSLDSGAASYFAQVHLNESSAAELAGRTQWFHLLTPRNGTTELVAVGLRDGDNALDVRHADGSGNPTITYDVYALAPNATYKIEARVVDDTVDIYVDGAFVGRYARLTTQKVNNLLFGATAGSGDVGEIYVDDVGATERRATSHVLLREGTNYASVWSGLAAPEATLTMRAPFDDTLYVNSTAAVERLANRTLPTLASDVDWSFQALAVAGPNGPGDAFALARVADASNVTLWAIALIDDAELGVWNGTGFEATGQEVTLGEWSRFDVTITPVGYRVWHNGDALTGIWNSATVFPVDSNLFGQNLEVGGGVGRAYVTLIEAFSGERYDAEPAERARHGWSAATGGTAVAQLATTGVGLADELPDAFVSGGRGHFIKSEGVTKFDIARIERPMVFPERFNLTTWVFLVDDSAVAFDNMTLLAIKNATGSKVFEANVASGATSTQLWVETASGGAGAQSASSGAPPVLPKGKWLRVTLEADRSNATYTLTTSLGHVLHGDGLDTAGWSSLAVGDLKSATGVGATGRGQAFWDDFVIRALNKHPVPQVSSATPAIVGGDFWFNGTVADEFQDPLRGLEVRVGSGDWAQINKTRFWSETIDTSTWTNNTYYWLNVRGVDVDRFGTDSFRVCYSVSLTDCNGASTEGSRATKVGKFTVTV